MYAIGIDLGTTNSAVAVMKGRPVIIEDEQGNRTVPSAVGWDNGEFVIGQEAKASPHIYDTVLSIKRKMGTNDTVKLGDREMTPPEISAEILKYLKKQVEDKTGETVVEAVITVPASFQIAQIEATKKAGELAGLKVQQTLAEPSAAVMAYGPQQDEKILVYDLGGGTFDVTIIDYFAGIADTLVTFGNNFLGGDDFDNRLVEHFRELIKNEQGVDLDLASDTEAHSKLKRAAERAKIDLSSRPKAIVEIPKVTSVDGRPIGLETVVQREEFEAMTADLVDSTMKEVEKALTESHLSKDDIDTILLVGGSTYMPKVQDRLQEFFGKEPNKTINPDLAVAMGAAASTVIGDSDERPHVVGDVHVPSVTPDKEIEIEGRTSPNASVSLQGAAAGTMTATADEEGYFTFDVSLAEGVNHFKIESTSIDGAMAALELEPILHDVAAKREQIMQTTVSPRLAWPLTVSCLKKLGPTRIMEDTVGMVVPGQSELPVTLKKDDFYTSADNMRRIVGQVLEGDLPVASLNTKLGELFLDLPPNVPEGEPVYVTYHVDESRTINATIECAGRSMEATITFQPMDEQTHIFSQLENLLTKWANRMTPQEREELEGIRATIERLTADYWNAEKGNDSETCWNAYNQVVAEAKRLRELIAAAGDRYDASIAAKPFGDAKPGGF